MPEKPISKSQDISTTGVKGSAPPPVQERPSPPPRTIVSEEHGSDGSYTIVWSDGSTESGQGRG
jgi:hypothetical protein